MREIEFRGKDVVDGEWVYGNYVETAEEYSDESISAIIEGCCEHRYGGEYFDCGWYQINKDTLGQYTGLTDKNGTKIFEGDIVKAKPYLNEEVAVVLYDDCGFRTFKIEKDRDYYFNCKKYNGLYLSYLTCPEGEPLFVAEKLIEVIGNIWDNPELLEG